MPSNPRLQRTGLRLPPSRKPLARSRESVKNGNPSDFRLALTRRGRRHSDVVSRDFRERSGIHCWLMVSCVVAAIVWPT